ncbi:MAG: SRPBCC family protein [Solirubrobacteraceae bacterium]
MRTVTVTQRFEGSVPEAEARWYDVAGWPRWVDECDRVLEVSGDWPNVGAKVIWESGPAGRGRVTEEVVEYEPRRGQTVEVQDGSIRGRQTVAFTPEPPGVQVAFSLAYQIQRRSLITPVVDLLFIRRPMSMSLERTVTHFGVGLQAASPASP